MNAHATGLKLRKGWLAIPGVQSGERSLSEQLRGLGPALADCADRTVIDFGCAEGLIGIEFAKAGAAAVLGYELLDDFVKRAREQAAAAGCGDRCMFIQRDLSGLCAPKMQNDIPSADVVLLLAIVHKLRNPGLALQRMADLARQRVVIRLPFGSAGLVACKYDARRFCDSLAVMRGAGFTLATDLEGPRRERVHHWVRT